MVSCRDGPIYNGGQRYNDENGEEFIYYFNPGDLKPPLNVYFSGYRSLEGFEGYFMMNSLDAPFLLIGDLELKVDPSILALKPMKIA